MEWLVLIHVMSSFLGIGPTFFGHILFRKKQHDGQLRQSLALFEILNYFPKIGGTIAVATGIALVIWSGWKFTDIWILISLIIYVLIQIIAVGMLGPIVNQLVKVMKVDDTSAIIDNATTKHSAIIVKINRLYNLISLLAVILITLMVVKPM